jgi:hypothetical protein
MDSLLDQPAAVAAALLRDAPIFGVNRAAVCLNGKDGVVIELELTPWMPCADEGFPPERVRILATVAKSAYVVPQEAEGRSWKHRMPGDLGELCLWFPQDSRALTWEWSDGLLDLITIAHRHLQYEEYWRRTGTWPVEDAPHGEGKHPLRTRQMLDAAEQWSR